MKKLLISFLLLIIGIITAGCVDKTLKAEEPLTNPPQAKQAVKTSSYVYPYNAWTSTFQLCWNEFIKLVGTPKIEYISGNPPLADELNKQQFTKDDLSEDSYYISVSKQTMKHKKEIEKAIKEKFNEKSDILDSFQFDNVDDDKTNKWFIYSILLKNFKFIKPYALLDSQYFNNDKSQKYKYFGYTSSKDDKENQWLREKNTESLFYVNDDDFAVKFTDKDNREEMIIYLTSSDKSFDELYMEILNKNAKKNEYTKNRIKEIESKYNEPVEINFSNFYKIPFMHIDEKFNFDKELANIPIKDKTYDTTGYYWVILQTLQTVKFDMDNEGAKLKSEAAISVLNATSAMPIKRKIYINNLYYFDRPFVMYLKEKGKDKPYFAARVKDGKYLVKE